MIDLSIDYARVMRIKNSSIDFVCKLNEREYPDLDRLFDATAPFPIDTGELLDGLETLFDLMDRDNCAVVKLEFMSDCIRIASQPMERGKYSFDYSSDEMETPEKDFTVGLNLSFFLEAVKHNKRFDKLMVSCAGPVKPFLMSSLSGYDNHVLMPVKIKW